MEKRLCGTKNCSCTARFDVHTSIPDTLLHEKLFCLLQLNLKLKRLRSHCHLYTESGEQISQSMDKKVENHFNQLLERVSRWNNSDSGTTEYDASSYLFARGHDALPIWYKNALKQSQLLNVETAATDVTGMLCNC